MTKVVIDSFEKLNIKLTKANEVIAKIAANEEYITPVSTEDRHLFEEFLAKEKRHTYGNSWVYISQGVCGIGSNILGYKYYDGKILCMLCAYPKVEDPNTIMLYWIRPLGEGVEQAILECANRIQIKFGISSYIKKLFLDQFNFFLTHGFKSSQDYPWHSGCHSEDDTFPEIVYNTEKTLTAFITSSKRRSLGYIARESAKLTRRNKIEIVSENFPDHAWQVAQKYFEIYNREPRKLNISTMFDYYHMIFNCIPKDDIVRKIVLVNEIPTGFYVLERNKSFDVASIYGLLIVRDQYRRLSDYVIIDIFKNEKSKYINIGGSEDEGLHTFKKKYQPIQENKMYWVTNYPL